MPVSDDPGAWRRRLRCNAAGVDPIFPDCLAEARQRLSPEAVDRWLEGASTVCGLGRGQELPVIYLQVMPRVAATAGPAILDAVADLARFLSRSGSAAAIGPLLGMMPAVARRLETLPLIEAWFDLVRRLAQEAPLGLVPFVRQSETLLAQLPIGGVRNWVAYGLRTWRRELHRVADYFSLQSADSRAAFQRERHGTLLVDRMRTLELSQRALWGEDGESAIEPFSTAYDIDRTPRPHLDRHGFHLPDVLDDLETRSGRVSGLDRYRAALAHLAAHRRWTRPLIADNFNRYQQLLIETFEDSRVEWLAIRRYPGLARLWRALHPVPREDACPPGHSCIRHHAAMLSRALLDPAHGYGDPRLLLAVGEFQALMARDPFDVEELVRLAIAHLVRIHEVDFRSPHVHFTDTEVGYRDDNRYLWIFLEDTEADADFHSEHHVANPKTEDRLPGLPGRHHPEWDRETGNYRPDWVTVYEGLAEAGDPAQIETLLRRQERLVRRLKSLVEVLRPQGRIRVRHREEGTELDIDLAVQSMIDRRAGMTPDPRVEQRQEPDARDFAVMLLLDLSESVNDRPERLDRSLLELSREAASLLGWMLEELGDPFAIAGFASNGRHEVRYQHVKGFGEAWGEDVKARLAGLRGAWSTRMGAALRHAGHYLARQPAEKRLLLLITDGEPADVDVPLPEDLREDARMAVEELRARGVTTFCLSLDPEADAYVSRIFGANRFFVLDRVERLPEFLPSLYLRLTA